MYVITLLNMDVVQELQWQVVKMQLTGTGTVLEQTEVQTLEHVAIQNLLEVVEAGAEVAEVVEAGADNLMNFSNK